MDILLESVLVLVLVALNGFFVAAEFAIVKIRSSQLEEHLQKKDKRARLAKEILQKLDTYLSASQVGITLASLALGWVGEPLTEKLTAPIFTLIPASPGIIHAINFIVGFLLLTVLHIVLGEQIPKSIAISYELETTLKVSRPMVLFYKAFRPLIWVLNKLVNATLRIMGFPPVSEGDSHTREELRSVLIESSKSGAVKPQESEMIASMFDFGETTAREIMVHRSAVAALNLDAEPREILRIIHTEGFSRLPVYRNSIDEIVGVLYVKDLLQHAAALERLSVPSNGAHKEFKGIIERAIRKALFVSETQSLHRLLQEFQKSRVHMAIVVSEHGGVEGVVTMEDILEELVGEIRDESDTPADERDVIEVGENLYVNPIISLSDFNERFEGRYPILEESNEYSTLSGYVQKHAGKIPNVGDTVEVNGLRFTVTRKVRHRLQQVKIERIAVPTEVE